MDDFTGVGAVVTGGASGIGLGLATALLEDGARGVAVLDVEAAALDAAVAQLRSGFPDATVVELSPLPLQSQRNLVRGLLDLERALAGFGLPVLGQLPLLPADARLGVGNVRAQRRQRDLYAHLFPQSLMAERCRGVRTALTFAQGREPVGSIMITSPSSSEGKSSIAINLALSFCQANKKVVLIDADMRRPRIHHVFAAPVENEELGLASVLSERASLDDALLPPPEDAPESLTILPCGQIPDNPAELLEGPGFRRMLGELRERFDLVIVDSPPVLPVTDPLILAGQADAVVLVTRCDSTTRGELQRALSQLSQADANIMGVILNEVDTRQERYDYHGDYYTYRAPATGSDSA